MHYTECRVMVMRAGKQVASSLEMRIFSTWIPGADA